MFFSYVSRVCVEDKREMAGGVSQANPSYAYQMTPQQREMAAQAAAAKAHELHLSGMSLRGGG